MKAHRSILIIILFSLAYAILRYGIVKDEPTSHWPAFIGQKGLAVAAVGALLLAIIRKFRGLASASHAYKASFILAVTHGIVSVVILKPEYLGYLFLNSGKLNLWGELAVVFGGVALAVFLALVIWRSESRYSELGLLCILLAHTFSVGILKWIDLSRWTYGLVPISLIGFLLLVAAIAYNLKNNAPDKRMNGVQAGTRSQNP